MQNDSIITLNGSQKTLSFSYNNDFSPDDDTADETIFWTGTGYRTDSPYGYWKNNGNSPASFKPDDRIDLVQICNSPNSNIKTIIQAPKNTQEKEITALFSEELPGCFKESIIGIAIYTPVSINPPAVEITHDGTAPRNCNPEGTECTITGAGELTTKFKFKTTKGKLYIGIVRNDGSIITPYKALEEFSIPEIVIEHKTIFVNAPIGNSAPTPPLISPCGTTIYQGDIINYSATSTDPDNDKMRFQIDWDNDGTYDMLSPNLFSVNSGQSYSFGKQWTTTGNKNFKVRTEDEYGNLSEWSACNTNVNEYRATATCGIGGAGEELALTANVTGGQGPYTYEWTQLNTSPYCEIVSQQSNQAKIKCASDGSKEILLIATDSANRTTATTTKCNVISKQPYCFIYTETGTSTLGKGNNKIRVIYADFKASPEGIQQALYCGNGNTTIMSCYNAKNEPPYNGDCETTCNYASSGNYSQHRYCLRTRCTMQSFSNKRSGKQPAS